MSPFLLYAKSEPCLTNLQPAHLFSQSTNMKRHALTLPQKKQISKERKRRERTGEKASHALIAEWAKREFKLDSLPGKAVMSRILNDAALDDHDPTASNSAFRRKGGMHVDLERTLFGWVCDMRNSRKCISGAIIRSKAIQLAAKSNECLQSDDQITTQFSDGWLEKFKKRWYLKAYKLHGEAGDVDNVGIDNALETIRANISKYPLKDVFNCDESGLFFQMAPDKTIAPSSFSGRKVQKERFTFLACCNADGTEKLPLVFIGKAKKPRCFKKNSGAEHGLYYKNNQKAWMTASIFFDWLHYVDRKIGKTDGRKILLLMDNCSAHGTKHTLPELDNIDIQFLPPNTTSKLQPLDAGIIAAMKKRYRKRQMEHAVDLLDVGVLNIYKNDILTAMRWLETIWANVTEEIIRNCWGTTGIVPAYDTVESVSGDDDSEDDRVIASYVARAVPHAIRRIPVSEIMQWEDGMAWTQEYTEQDMVHEIVNSATDPDDEHEAEEDGANTPESRDLGTYAEQLKTIAQTKLICVALGIDNEPLFTALRSVQTDLSARHRSSMTQSTIDTFFRPV